MASKIGIFFAVVCLLQPHLNVASDVDWEILNFAISDPAQSNPAILKDAILNILGGFASSVPLPSFPTAAPGTPAPPKPTAAPTAAPPRPTAAPAPAPVINWQFLPPQQPGQAPIYINPIYLQQLQQAQQQAQQQNAASPVASPVSNFIYQHKRDPCGPNKVAEFLVNVPCPKPTQKPPREIVVKLPCPTTKKPHQPECGCNCCPCNPCNTPKSTKAPKTTTTTTAKPSTTTSKHGESYSSESSEDSYEHYYPRGKFQKIVADA